MSHDIIFSFSVNVFACCQEFFFCGLILRGVTKCVMTKCCPKVLPSASVGETL